MTSTLLRAVLYSSNSLTFSEPNSLLNPNISSNQFKTNINTATKESQSLLMRRYIDLTRTPSISLL